MSLKSVAGSAIAQSGAGRHADAQAPGSARRGVHDGRHGGDHRHHRHAGGRGDPQMLNGVDGMRLGVSARDVERELQFARLKAVSTNRPMRIRFNRPWPVSSASSS